MVVDAPAHDLRVNVAEGPADVLGKSEILLPIAGVEIVKEDAADTAGLVAVLVEEVLVAPFLELRVIAGVVLIAGLAQGSTTTATSTTARVRIRSTS